MPLLYRIPFCGLSLFHLPCFQHLGSSRSEILAHPPQESICPSPGGHGLFFLGYAHRSRQTFTCAEASGASSVACEFVQSTSDFLGPLETCPVSVSLTTLEASLVLLVILWDLEGPRDIELMATSLGFLSLCVCPRLDRTALDPCLSSRKLWHRRLYCFEGVDDY